MKTLNYYYLLSFFVIFSSCVKNEVDIQQPDAENIEENIEETSKQALEKLSIPNDFNFETERKITLTINDATPYVKYEVFAYSDNGSAEENITEALNNLLYSGKPYNGSLSHKFSLSTNYNKAYVLRKDGLEYSSEIMAIINNKIDFNVSTAGKSANKSTRAYKVSDGGCVECTDNFFINSDFEDGPVLPTTWRIPNEKDVNGWSTTATDSQIELWKSGFQGVPAQSGSYFSELNANQSSALYQRICTSPGAEISWSVWHRGRAGTDTAVVRIGEDLLSATTEATMTTGNTAWVQYSGIYTVPAAQGDTYFIFEAVSTAASSISVGNFIDNIEITETVAGDCAEVINKMFYPTKFAITTIAFEDLWPYTGDYDFNDLIISYNVETILNTENNVTQLDFNYIVESIGGSFNNGFGIELEGVLPSSISSVTGPNLTEGIITNNANGTEQGQPNAVIIFFDDSHKNVGLINTISIVFSSPITTEALGTAPFNPFLIVNKDRLKEIHLPNKPTTIYPTTAPIDNSLTIADSDGDFKSTVGLPWAINITGEYKAPKEGTVITDAYNFFADWASSGGVTKTDWYQNLSGHINTRNLKD